MTAAFIVDCSIAMSWLFEEEQTAAIIQVLDRLDDEVALVPPVWFLEVTNTVVVAERRKRVTHAKSDEFIAQLSNLDFEVDAEPSQYAFKEVLRLARRFQLSSYDATYLDLAVRRKLPLASLDEALRKSAKKLGVKLLGK
jgi:predicted nucleic acid-binding protein